MVLQPGLRLGRYVLERELGAGGMGVVFLARDTMLARPVAIKFLSCWSAWGQDEAARARFLHEARIAANIRDPHVVTVHDWGTLDSGEPYLVMEHVEGETLARVLERSGALAYPRVCTWLAPLLAVLADAHAKGIVHRDLKPQNLMLTKDPDGAERVKLLDFGVAKSAGFTGHTRASAFIGTPSYMSPEQIDNPATVTPATDVWALGVVLHELLTGEKPFRAEHAAMVARAILADAPAPLRVPAGRPVPPVALVELIARCLNKQAAARPTTRDVAQRLAEAPRGVGAGSPLDASGRAARGTPGQPMRSRSPLLALTLLPMSLIALVAFVGWRLASTAASTAPLEARAAPNDAITWMARAGDDEARGDGVACLASLERYDKAAAPGQASTELTSLMMSRRRARCLMLAGRCVEGRALLEAHIKATSQGQQVNEVIAGDQEIGTYCRSAQLDARDAALVADARLGVLVSEAKEADAAECIKLYNTLIENAPKVTPRYPNDGATKLRERASWFGPACLEKAGDCAQAYVVYQREFKAVYEPRDMRRMFEGSHARCKGHK